MLAPRMNPVDREKMKLLYACNNSGSSFADQLLNNANMRLDFRRETLDSRITATRASTKTYFDSTGTMQTAAIDAFPREYDPSTLKCLGRSFWEARTNSIRNNTMQGAAAGTPGTDPTNWAVTPSGGSITTVTIVGVGTENGINYIDYRYITSGATAYSIIFESATQIVATDGQTWTGSVYGKFVGGSFANVSANHRIVFRTAAGAGVTTNDVAFLPTSAALNTQRHINTFLASGGTIARVTNQITVSTSGASDITLRIGMPQLELGATATPVIATTSAAVTRSADVVSMTSTNFSSWYNQTEGTLLASYIISSDSSASVFPGAFVVSDGTANERMGIYSRTVDDTNRASVVDGGVSQADLSIGSVVYASSQTAVLAYKANDIAYSSKGLTVQTDTTATIPTVTQADIGVLYVGTNWLNGWISRITYWPARLPNTDLQIISRSA